MKHLPDLGTYSNDTQIAVTELNLCVLSKDKYAKNHDYKFTTIKAACDLTGLSFAKVFNKKRSWGVIADRYAMIWLLSFYYELHHQQIADLLNMERTTIYTSHKSFKDNVLSKGGSGLMKEAYDKIHGLLNEKSRIIKNTSLN